MNDFDHHWVVNQNDLVAQKKTEVALRFLKPVLVMLKTNERLCILDAGCGDGVHAQVLSEVKGAYNYCGIDISKNAVSTARSRVDDNRFVFSVEDVMATSFDSEIFDIVFSYGVIAYTKSPEKSVMELSRVTKTGGLVGLWLYPKPTGLLGDLFRMTQWVCMKGGDRVAYHIANLIVPFMRLLPVSSGVHLGNASWKQCREVVLVNIAPLHLRFPDRSEIIDWFAKAGLEITNDDLENPVTIWAVKK